MRSRAIPLDDMLPEKIRVHIRWMIQDDMPEVLTVEADGFEFPWTEDDFKRCLRCKNHIGMVAEHDDRVVGFMIYELNKGDITVLNFAMAGDLRRRGIGTQMADKLKGKLSAQRRLRLIVNVAETSLDAQFFWRAMGFRATKVLREHYEDGQDAYHMVYQLDGREPFVPTNRISRLCG